MKNNQASGQIKITMTKVLQEGLWGAKECYDLSGETGVMELINEDIGELVDGAEFEIEVVEDE
jgi:hypothetical protein